MKKQSTTKQVLNILNTQGGKKPKQLIALTKASSASVYNALHQLRNKKMIAKEDDGVYISQTQKEVSSKVTDRVVEVHGRKYTFAKRGNTPNKLIKSPYITNLEKENDQLNGWCLEWRSKYDALEEKTNGLRNVVADQSAIICYLEAKLFKGEFK
jgi:hypothetical protein